LFAVALASGSNGNSVYVETADARLLFDAGLSGRRLQARAESRGVDLARVDALILSHNHSDHTAGAGVLHRRFGLPLYATKGTWKASRGRLGRVVEPRLGSAGETLRFGKTVVETLATPHDGREGVAFVVESEGTRLGVLTDLGHLFPALRETFPTLDAAFLEANYDPGMLWNGTYPPELCARISGPGGHLSNEECLEMAGDAANDRLRHLVLSHLSGENNSPEIALRTADPLQERGVTVHLAPRTEASPIVDLRA